MSLKKTIEKNCLLLLLSETKASKTAVPILLEFALKPEPVF